MDFTPIELAGQTYRLRFTPPDIQEICRRLTAFQTSGSKKVMPPALGDMLINLDPDSFQYCLWAALHHTPKYRDIDPSDAMAIFTKAIDEGQQWTDFRAPMFRALINCGYADFKPILKILEAEEIKARM